MSRLSDLLRELRQTQPRLARDVQREVAALTDRRAFGLNFERHVPEAVDLPGRKVRKGDKVRILPDRGQTPKISDEVLWQVSVVDSSSGTATLRSLATPTTDFEYSESDSEESHFEAVNAAVDNLVVVAEFRDPIYPGLVSTGTVERGGDKPYHTVLNAENFHALEALLFTHRGVVDCIYIDPPYNTRDKDWKYNNDYVDSDDQYRHSKWLAMMERRLYIAKNLLNAAGTLVVTIDEREMHRLGLLLDQVFPEYSKQMVTIVINPKGVTQGYLSRVEEYAIFCFGPESKVCTTSDDLLTQRQKTKSEDGLERPRWKGLLRSGDEARREDREKMFYPIWIDPQSKRLVRAGSWLPLDEEPDFDTSDEAGNVVAWPVRKDGSLGRWGVGRETLNQLIESGYAALGRFDRRRKTWSISYLSQQVRDDLDKGLLTVLGRDETTGVADVAYVDAASRRVRTVWHRSSHDAGVNGTDLVGNLLGAGRAFPFPKSLYAVEDTLRILVKDKPDAVILDFFAGSGTTAHAVMRLNRQDGGRRQCILVTNNEVAAGEQASLRAKGLRPGDVEWEQSGICEYITKPRVKSAITGETPDGQPIKGAYKFTDEFPMANGLEENVEFFTLTYEAPLRVSSHREFLKISPLLWMRAGSVGRRIEDISAGWDVAEAYGVLADLDQSEPFLEAIASNENLGIAYIVTDEDRLFESISQQLPKHVEPVRLYEAYLRNFEIESGRGSQ
jgi:adenine-specific DNA-methyltransferase